jgi:hypothetical protein
MHDAAFEWVGRYATPAPLWVLDIGGRDINGTCRPHFPNADYWALDITDGPGIDFVADATTWNPDTEYDIVVCAEVFEHARGWRDIPRTAFAALVPGGKFIVTTATGMRAPHNATDGGAWVPQGEYYGNVDPEELLQVLQAAGFESVTVDVLGEDVRAYAVKP